MVDRGAQRIVLIGRRGVVDDDQVKAIERLGAAGATIEIAEVDVGDGEAVDQLLREVRARHSAICGIVHSTLVLDDRLIADMSHEAYVTVTCGKVLGAWHLHRLTAEDPLDIFVCLSSIATTLGNSGQSNYVVANAYLDHLMAARRQSGLPGLALALGPVADAGYVARTDGLRWRTGSGSPSITVADVLRAFDTLLPTNRSCAALCDIQIAADLPICGTSRLSRLIAGRRGDHRSGTEADRLDLSSLPADERLPALEVALLQMLAQVMDTTPERIAADQTLPNIGMDSLMALEFGLEAEKRLGITVPTTMIMQDVTVASLAQLLLKRMGIAGPEAPIPDENIQSPARLTPIGRSTDGSPLVVVFPFLGAIQADFQQFQEVISPHASTSLVLGPNGNANSDPTDLLARYVELSAQSIAAHANARPVFLAGFSLGAHLAFQVALELESMAAVRLQRLYAVTANSPFASLTLLEGFASYVDRLEEDIAGGKIGDEELVALAKASPFRFDHRVIEQPRKIAELLIAHIAQLRVGRIIAANPSVDRVRIPITAIKVKEDALAGDYDVNDWKRATQGDFDAVVLDHVDDHYFIVLNPDPVAEIVLRDLADASELAEVV